MDAANEAAARRLLDAGDIIAAKAGGHSLADYARAHYGPGELAQARADAVDANADADAVDGARDADALALRAMDGSDRIDADERGLSPATYLRSEYGIDVRKSEYADVDDVHDDILAALEGLR